MNPLWLLLIVPVSAACGAGLLVLYALLQEAQENVELD